MSTRRQESGFTAVELLITLFVAAAFLIAAYQLFNLIVKDGGATRSESRAANVAYDYLRRYAATSTTIPCTASNPVPNTPITVAGLTSVTINVDVSCLPGAIASLSKVTATIKFNNPQQSVQYATYVSSSGAPTSFIDSQSTVAYTQVHPAARLSGMLAVRSQENLHAVL